MIKRVLMAVINYDHPQRGMEHGFRGIFGSENVMSYDYLERQRKGLSKEDINREFISCASSFAPDWIWLQVQMTGVISESTINTIKKSFPRCVVSHWMGDMRLSVSPYLSGISRACHLTLISNEGQYGIFQNAGAKKVSYCQIAVDWEEDVIGLPAWEVPFGVPDVVFCGSNYGNTFPGTVDRESAAKALIAAHVDFGIVGSNWQSRGRFPVVSQINCHKRQYHVYQQCKIALNINNFNDVKRYYSDRLLIAMASGRPVVAKRIPGIEEDFIDGLHLVLYDTDADLVGKVRALLSDEHLRKHIGKEGRAAILKSHTWFNRILGLLPEIESIREGL